MWWRQPTACMTGATSWRWRAVPSSVWWLESTITANTMRWEHHQKDKTNKQTLPNNTNNKQVMVGEHDHCKHNEVKTSWEKKTKQTNKENKRQKKQQPSDGWDARPLQAQQGEKCIEQHLQHRKQTATKIHINIMAASTTRWEMHRTTSTTSKNKQQQKFTSTSWLQAQRGDKLYDASTEIMIITNKLFETITSSNNNNKWQTTSKSSNNKRPQQKTTLSNNKQQSGRRQELRARLCSAQAP